MDAFDNPARNGMTGPERDGASTEQANRAAPGGEFLAAAANVTAAASIIPLAIQAILVPDASGRIVLPAGASIDDITISGTDLVITLPNGQVFIIPGGAVDVPSIVVDGDTVPASTVAQLLENLGELNPEAGVRSSGGNFADPEGPIQDAYALGDLLPYTQLAFPQPEDRELLPAVSDEEPTIAIVTPDQPAGLAAATASVNEAGLPVRGTEPAGSNSAANSETTTGSIVYDAGDGLDAITINGTAITAVGQVITTPLGQLTITSLTPGNVGYSYTLTDNTNANNNLTDPFTVVVTDNDGDTATATLTISVVDDVPTARNDTDRVAAGSFAPETGNVLTGTGTTSGAAGADTPGADGATLTGVRGGAGSEGSFSAPGTVQGQYGTLTINAQGGYTYVRNPGTPGGVNDVFTYRITDGDGDTSTATLTISIADAPTVITFVPGDGEGDGGTVVYEADLGPREGEALGSAFDGDAASTSGTITFTAVDGIGSVSIGGVVVTPGSLPQTISSDATGTLVVTGYSFDAATGQGSVTYVYTLIDNTLDGDGTTVSFALVITDADGDAATDTLEIDIVDDAPTARADVDSVTEDSGNGDNPPVADGNVFTGLGGGDANATDGVADTQGADGATVTAVTGGTLGEAFAGAYGSLTLNADGSYSYMLNNSAQPVQGLAAGETLTEVFTYTITDGDGDTSSATLMITINGADDGVTINGLNAEGAEVIVNEDDLSDGSSPDAAALTQGGDFSVSTPDGLGNVTIGGTQVVTNGIFTAGTATSPLGTINITGFTPVIGADGSVIGGTFTYNYVLSDNTLTHTSLGEDFVGDSFAVVVTDSDGSSANASLDVRIIDDVPTAADDSAGAAEDTPVIIDVLANDVRGADGVDPATGVALATAPTKGSVVYNGDGTFTYTPTPGQEGTDSFTYTITDNDGDTSTATVTVTLAQDSVPTIDLGADNSVDEAGLPNGSNAASNSETTTGSFTLTTGNDSVASLVIDGVDVTAGGTVTTPRGVLTVTVSGGVYSYNYTLTTNTSGDDTFDSFTAVVTDSDGDTATDTLVINIVDDVPTANPDTDSVTEDGPTVANGNVLTGVGGNDANATDGALDTQGADGATVTALVGGTVGTPLVSTYGTLTLNADGSYSYVLNNAAQPVQGLSPGETLTEIFTYTITDGDGDPSTTTLTITINGANDGVKINGLDADGAELYVDEDDLPARAGEAAGSDTTPESLTDSDSFTVTTPDGMGTVVLNSFNGVPFGAPLTLVVANGTFTPQSVATAYGTLNITGFTPVIGADGSVIAGTFTYSYTLADNLTDHPLMGQDYRTDSIGVTVTDIDGSTASASLDIRITDDVPTASAEPRQNVAEGATITGTLDFVQGADGATVTQIGGTTLVFGADGFSQVIDIGAGTIKVKADGSYSFTADPSVPGVVDASTTYTVRDGDGDTSTAPINFRVLDTNVPTGGVTQTSVDDDALAGGNPGSTVGDLADPNSDGDNNQATFSGLLNISFGGDGPGGISFAGMNGLFVNIGQESVQLGWNAGTNTLTGTGPRGVLFTVEVTNPATGAYKVTLVDNVLHTAGNNENDATVTLGFIVSDSDGSTANGALQILFDDDAPTVVASGTQPTLTVDESTLGTDASLSFASVFTPTFGADGAATTNATTYSLGIADGTSGLIDAATNQAIVLSVVGGVIQGRTATSNELVFTVSVAANGTVTLDQLRAVVHTPNSGPNQSISLSGDNLITLTATVTDADGDTATAIANIGQNLVFNDDAPVANDDTAGLTEGGPISVTFDVDTNDNNGADGFGSRTFTSLTGTYGTITINGDGTQTYTLSAAGQTAINALAPGATLTDSFTYTLTDKDGDSDPATLVVTLTGDDDGVTITNLIPAANGGDVTVDEDDLPAGSDPTKESLTQAGTFNISAPDGVDDLTIGGQSVITNGVFTAVSFVTPFGNTLNITAYNAATGQISYTYTLTAAENHATGAGENSLFENFAVVLTDVDNDTANGILSVNIIDDVPTAVNDTDSIAAGSFAAATGNVITDAAAGDAGDGDTGADTRGADGAAVSAIVSVNVPANSDTTADGSGNFQVNGQYGALTINADGSYSYTRAAGTAGGVSDTFTYTLRDGDGDIATATLTISIADAAPVTAANAAVLLDDDALPGGIAAGTGDDINSQNPTGTLSGSGGDGALTYALNATGAPAGFSYEMSGGNLLVKQSGVTVLTVTVNPANGAYSVTQNAPIQHPAGLDENNLPFTVNYSVTDIDGDTAGGTLSINVDDDTPTVTLTANDTDTVLLTTQDAQTIGAASDFETSTANFGGVFALTSAYGADGAGTTTLAYALGLVGSNGTDSTLDSNGASIFLYTGTGGTIIGSTSATAGSVNAANTIFSLAVNATTGAVTLTQFAEIDHAPNADTSAPYDDQFAVLATNLVRLTGTATITDADSDTRTSTAFIDLGGNIRFADDGPSIAVGAPLPTLSVDESNFGLNAVSAAVFTTNFGADGAGTVTYALGINGGSTGLVDTATGQNVVLTLVGGQVVATAGVGGATVFTLSVDGSGNITLDQIRAIAHDTDGGPGAAHDDAKSLLAANLVTLTGTVTDGDGDIARATINLGDRLTFRDDGPTTTADSGTTTEATLDFNAAFVLDFSGSIDDAELNVMLNAVRDAGLLLFANSSGDVSIRLIGFSSGAANLGMFTDPVSFVNAIDDLNPTQGGSRYANGNTDFTAGIQQLMSVYVPDPTASNQVFFLSDGNPNEQTGPGGSSLTAATATAWTNFVNNNDINVTAIGVGNGISNARLQDIDVDGEGAPILAANFDDLVQTLLDIVVALPVTGDLDANDNFGGDGRPDPVDRHQRHDLHLGRQQHDHTFGDAHGQCTGQQHHDDDAKRRDAVAELRDRHLVLCAARKPDRGFGSVQLFGHRPGRRHGGLDPHRDGGGGRRPRCRQHRARRHGHHQRQWFGRRDPDRRSRAARKRSGGHDDHRDREQRHRCDQCYARRRHLYFRG
jgi:VCBS repeat-containing protein